MIWVGNGGGVISCLKISIIMAQFVNTNGCFGLILIALDYYLYLFGKKMALLILR